MLLERMDRLEGTGSTRRSIAKRCRRRRVAVCAIPTRRPHMAVGGRGAGVDAVGAGVYLRRRPRVVMARRRSRRRRRRPHRPPPKPLPMVRTADTLLDHARALYVGRTPSRCAAAARSHRHCGSSAADADRLRADIQRDLLAASSAGTHRRHGRGRPVKCPKCDYLGFETGNRCKNCGYDFSLLSARRIRTVRLRYLSGRRR